MARTIWKFPLPYEKFAANNNADLTLDVQFPARPILFALQDGVPTLWCETDDESGPVPRTYRLVGTGHPIYPDGARDVQATHLGSLQDGRFVWHLYQIDPLQGF